jgi:hypothetical protein
MRFGLSFKGLSLPFARSPVFNRLSRLLASFSVRTRVIVLALIPVVGFLANGLTYVSGEGVVDKSFQTVKQARALADGSRDFKIAVGAMRIAVKNITTEPHTLIDSFGRSLQLANKSLDQIEASIGGKHADDIAALHQALDKLKKNFNQLTLEQRTLGFTESAGLHRELRDAGNKIETAINENMTWLADTEAKKLMIALLTMRHHEAEYRLNPSELTRQEFLLGYQDFTTTFANIDGTPEMKAAACRRHHRVRERRGGAGIGGIGGFTAPHPHRHYRGWHRHGRARPRFFLADRPQHHAPAQRPGQRDEAAGRRRHQRPYPRHHGTRRNWRDGAHGDRIPRQHDRARKAGRFSGRDQPGPGSAQFDDFADHRAIQAFG